MRFIPLILSIAIIIGFTTQDTAENVNISEKCRTAVVSIAEKMNIETNGVWWNNPGNFRKIAHTVEFFFLGITVCFAFRWFWLSLIICGFASVGDEMLKQFIPLRHLDYSDLPFDAVGYITGILLMYIIIKIFCREKK